MVYILCGLFIGAIAGLTGAGGALVAIPLFIYFFAMSIKQASFFALIAVFIASLLNFLFQRTLVNYRVAIVLVIFSSISSFFAASYKEALPDYVISIMLLTVSTYALYAVWFSRPKQSPNSTAKAKDNSNHILSIFLGLILGVLTTFTGLGGGVLMVPIFLKYYGFNQERAVATSLLAICFSSLASLLFQINHGQKISFDLNLVFLILGILTTAYGLKKLLPMLPQTLVLYLRKLTFTGVVVWAILTIF